jgi:hypothetical protein
MASVVLRIYTSGDVLSGRDALAVNFLMDRSAPIRNREIADLAQKLGACHPAGPHDSDTAMSVTFSFACERGSLKAKAILAPTSPASLQTLEFTAL